MALYKVLSKTIDLHDWNFFRLTHNKNKPIIQTNIDLGDWGKDPDGIYFFIKGYPCSSSIYEGKREYVWEAKMKQSARVLRLSNITWEQAWKWLKSVGIKNEKDILDNLDDYTLQTITGEIPFDQQGNDDYLIQWLSTSLYKNPKYKPVWYRVLRKKINNGKKLANLFLKYDALLDLGDGFFLDYEPQLVVLNDTAIEMRFIEGMDSEKYKANLK